MIQAPPNPREIHREMLRRGAVPTILQVFDNLPWARTGADWTAWRAFLAAAFGLPMTQREYDIFCRCTGRKDPPTKRVREAWIPAGRRARKTAIMSVAGTYLGCYEDYEAHLAPGERARGLIMAQDKDEAKQMHSFCCSILGDTPWLLEDAPTAEDILIANRTEMKIRAVSLTGGRSRAIYFAGFDELAFWPKKESSKPDADVINGVRFGMANIPGAMMMGASSPFNKKGVLWEKFKEHWGVESQDVLVWKAPTLVMHDTPAIRVFVREEEEKDPIAAAAEVGAEFRDDIDDYISIELLEKMTIPGRAVVPPADRTAPEWGSPPKRVPKYFAFVDVSGGSNDRFTLCISHWDHMIRKVVVDLLAKWTPPFSVKQVTKEATAHLKAYSIEAVKGDRYGGQWPREEFNEQAELQDWRIGYDVSRKTRHDIYLEVLPTLTSLSVEMLDVKVVREELAALQRRKTTHGREMVNHPDGGHDDLANAFAGSVLDAYQLGRFLEDEVIEAEPPRTTAQWVEDEAALAARDRSGREREDVQKIVWHDRWNY